MRENLILPKQRNLTKLESDILEKAFKKSLKTKPTLPNRL